MPDHGVVVLVETSPLVEPTTFVYFVTMFVMSRASSIVPTVMTFFAVPGAVKLPGFPLKPESLPPPPLPPANT